MGKRKVNRASAFYIETLALLAVFAMVTVILVKGFVLADRLSRKAEALSKAVHLAENAAEMAAASDSGEMFLDLLNENGNACALEAADALCSAYRAEYDAEMMPAKEGAFRLEVSRSLEQGGLVRSAIKVYWDDAAEPVYALDLAVYAKESS